ncbi:MAG: ferredoxin family protein [Anaerolineae bacterium]
MKEKKMKSLPLNVNIDYDLCTNCGICVRSCPVDVIRIEPESKIVASVYDHDCMLCKLCEHDCPEDCIIIDPSKQVAHIMSWG